MRVRLRVLFIVVSYYFGDLIRGPLVRETVTYSITNH